MREIRLQEIQKDCNTPEKIALKKMIRDLVRSKPGYNPERKRPRKHEEAVVLGSFSRKNGYSWPKIGTLCSVTAWSKRKISDEDYSTRDIDFVANDWDKAISLLQKLGFIKTNQNLLHKELEIFIDYNGSKLAGSMDKVNKVIINNAEDLYVYVISYEDIIMDRLRAYLHWEEDDSKEWGMQLLALHYDKLDQNYIIEIGKGPENEQEATEIIRWLEELKNLKPEWCAVYRHLILRQARKNYNLTPSPWHASLDYQIIW